MFCKNCGSEIDDNATVCIHCGAATQNNLQQQPVKTTNTLAIVGFVFAFIIPLVGLICSIMGYKRADRDFGGAQKGLALAGFIISLIDIVITLIIVITCWSIILAALGVAGSIPENSVALLGGMYVL